MLGQAAPVHRFQKIYLAGQPGQEDWQALKAAGFRKIINLRQPDEIPWDEATAVAQAGMDYVALPFRGPEQLTDQVFERALNELRDPADGMILLHCATSNRVGAIWYAQRVLADGIPAAQAEEEARQVGLHTPAYLERARQYIAAKEAQSDSVSTENE